MPRPRPHLLLRAPTPSQKSLSFCEANPREFKAWIASLPKANIGEMARLLYQGLTELNQLVTSSEVRLQLLELLRPEVYYVCRHLEKHFLNQAIVLDERARKVANLCQALQNHLAVGYKYIVVRLAETSPAERSAVMAIALQRAIHALNGPLVRAALLYCPPPEGLWVELHQLYLVAADQKVQHTPVADELAHHIKALTPEQAYLCALLLGCSRCNQMRQNSIGRLAEVLEAWSPLARLRPALAESSLFAVAPAIDGPPRYKSLFPEQQWPTLVGLDTLSVSQALQAYVALPPAERSASRLVVPPAFSLDLLQHLAAAWGNVSERTFERMPGTGNLTLCLGMSALHYYLAGERSFGEMLSRPSAGQQAQFSQGQSWAQIYEASQHHIVMEEIQYPAPSTEPGATAAQAPQHQEYPSYSLQIVNHSPGGYCLAWPREVPAQLQAGEIVGIQDVPSQGWSVAVVRWIRQVRSGGTQIGIELLAPHAQPCGVQLVRSGEPSSEYLRGLLLPEIRAIDVPATLVAPRLPFQEGHQVLINTQGDERPASLGKRVSATGSFNQFEYHTAHHPDEPPILQPGTEDAAPEENFDSLWRDL
ncbi:molecular chaperone [Pseudomonas typographi]|uniref:molecular chaperone n=1 Tax=Pseudomonas typographi TaxID=2715964 RepID=UPI001686B6DC|nr:molecular chaperone [Pseudomonas typographi]MBD1587615.1 molecular chaperone [Pseudomonas typographi]